MPEVRPYCTFEVEGFWLGVDVIDVQEVIRHREPTRVPTSSSVVHGLINLRGQIVTVIDLRARLGFPPTTGSEDWMDVVVRDQGGAVGLVVDQVGDVLEIDEDALMPAPLEVPESVRCLTNGLDSSTGRSLFVLDIARVVGCGG